jgi:hypothetical protein
MYDGYIWDWKAQLLNVDGTPRVTGKVINQVEQCSYLQFDVPVSAYTKDSKVRLIPPK